MNYLAHFHLAGASEGLIVGNFIADFVKGKKFREFPPEIIEGILMHREIDHFTDHHALVSKTKSRLYPVYHKYASVIVDIYFDHVLAVHWDQYSAVLLENYAQKIYATLLSNHDLLPAKAQYTLKYMIQHDWLSNYASLAGIDRVLTGMSRRTKFQSNMEHSVHELKRDYDMIKVEFFEFFEELNTHINKQKKG